MTGDRDTYLEKTRNYYNEKFAHLNAGRSGLNAEEEQRLQNIFLEIEKLPLSSKAEIIDFGCGRGWLSDKLSNRGNVTAVDISDETIRSAKEHFPHVRFMCGDVTSAGITGQLKTASFDLAVSSEVIEHVDKQEAYIGNLRSLLKTESSFLVLTTPNGKWKNHYFYGERKGWGQAYEFWLTREELEKMLRPYFSKIHIRSFNCDWIMQLRSHGMPNLLGSRIWIKFLKMSGLLSFYKRILEKRGYGLYLIITAAS